MCVQAYNQALNNRFYLRLVLIWLVEVHGKSCNKTVLMCSLSKSLLGSHPNIHLFAASGRKGDDLFLCFSVIIFFSLILFCVLFLYPLLPLTTLFSLSLRDNSKGLTGVDMLLNYNNISDIFLSCNTCACILEVLTEFYCVHFSYGRKACSW